MINIGIVFDQTDKSGGGYQQSITFLHQILRKSDNKYYIFSTNKNVDRQTLKNEKNIEMIFYLKKNYVKVLLAKILNKKVIHKLLISIGIKYSGYYDGIVKKFGIDLMVYLSPSPLVQAFNAVNYIVPIWDLDFRLNNEFPEVAWNGEFEYREKYYKNTLIKAYRIIVESEYSKRLVIKYYGVDEERIIKINFIPTEMIINNEKKCYIKDKYRIKKPYIFYPAQFWPHKNHIYILEAIRILKFKYNIHVNAVFCGGDKGSLKKIQDKTVKYNLEENINILGFIPREDLEELYKNTIALVMPSYMGFSNLPPIEALFYNVPIIYSNMPQFQEQMGNAALYIDLDNPEELSKIIYKIITDNKYLIELKNCMNKKRKEILSDESIQSLFIAINQYMKIVRTWKM